MAIARPEGVSLRLQGLEALQVGPLDFAHCMVVVYRCGILDPRGAPYNAGRAHFRKN